VRAGQPDVGERGVLRRAGEDTSSSFTSYIDLSSEGSSTSGPRFGVVGWSFKASIFDGRRRLVCELHVAQSSTIARVLEARPPHFNEK
jgi:hypothetical protein